MLPQRSPQSWLKTTGQYWKYLVFCVLILTAGSLFVLFVVHINTDDDSLGWYASTSIAAAAAAFSWLIASIRCPRCHRSVAWWILTHASAENWLTQLTDATKCAVCGDGGYRERR
jgi:hypothetical protein